MENRLAMSDKIQFDCFPGIQCFTQCCRDVNIMLTPYDVLRLKNALGMSSEDFLDKHTIILYKEKKLLPIVMLKMQEGKDKRCPFVSNQGCKVYENRPWACRIFPLSPNEDGSYKIIADKSRCLGLKAEKKWTVSEWLLEQGVPEYDYVNRKFSEITDPLKTLEKRIENPRIQDMLLMALYNLDKFREFIITSSFLQKFELSLSKIQYILASDMQLLMLGLDWIKFSLFGHKTLKLRKKKSKTKNE